MKKWLVDGVKLLGTIIMVVLAAVGAVIAGNTAKRRQKLAEKENGLQNEVSEGTHEARVHREKQKQHQEAAKAAREAAEKRLQTIKDASVGDLVKDFNKERQK